MKSLSKKNVLCFSSENELLQNFKQILKSNFKIYLANNYKIFLSQILKNQFSLLIIDLEDEIEKVLNQLKSIKEKNRNVCIIVLYGYRFNKPQYETLIHSIADYLFYKPVTIENVLDLIDKKFLKDETK